MWILIEVVGAGTDDVYTWIGRVTGPRDTGVQKKERSFLALHVVRFKSRGLLFFSSTGVPPILTFLRHYVHVFAYRHTSVSAYRCVERDGYTSARRRVCGPLSLYRSFSLCFSPFVGLYRRVEAREWKEEVSVSPSSDCLLPMCSFHSCVSVLGCMYTRSG